MRRRRFVDMERPKHLAKRMQARAIVTKRLRMFFAFLKERLSIGADQLLKRSEELSKEKQSLEDNRPKSGGPAE
jgi:hypothetical protein